MFLNDLIIPNNFISLENYKTKTNPQTTTFCDKLRVDDPLALVLGHMSRSNLSLDDDQIMDSTFSSFVNSTLCSNDEDEVINSRSEKLSMSPFVLPEPKNDTINTDTDENSDLNFSSFITSNSFTEESDEKINQSHGKYYWSMFK